MRRGMKGNSVVNRKSGGFTIIGMMLGLTVMAIVGSASLAFFNRFRVCNGESEVENQAKRVIKGIVNYKDYYGIWPYFGDANGEPERSTYGLVDYVFPVGNWFEVQTYDHYLPAILSGENRFGCNPLGQCFETFSESERKGKKIHRFWLYLREKNPSNLKELREPYRLWERLARRITGKDEYGNDVLEKITKAPAGEICGDEALFYIPKPNETLEWQPDASERMVEWSDDGTQKKRNTGSYDFFLQEEMPMFPERN